MFSVQLGEIKQWHWRASYVALGHVPPWLNFWSLQSRTNYDTGPHRCGWVPRKNTHAYIFVTVYCKSFIILLCVILILFFLVSCPSSHQILWYHSAVAVMYFKLQCLHIVINYLQLPETNKNMLYFVPLSPASTEFRKNIEIPRRNGQILWLGSKFHVPWKTVFPSDANEQAAACMYICRVQSNMSMHHYEYVALCFVNILQ